jgi:hypothetical protein
LTRVFKPARQGGCSGTANRSWSGVDGVSGANRSGMDGTRGRRLLPVGEPERRHQADVLGPGHRARAELYLDAPGRGGDGPSLLAFRSADPGARQRWSADLPAGADVFGPLRRDAPEGQGCDGTHGRGR